MAKRARAPEEFGQLLAEQLRFLAASAQSYDNGFEGEAKRLAVAIRVLVHETKTSHSLLGQVGKRDAMFWDAAVGNESGNVATYGGLVFTQLSEGAARYVAMLDGVPTSRQVPFEDWWNASVFAAPGGISLSRKDLVLAAANQDGGAHVDPSLDEAYASLSRDNLMGAFVGERGSERPMPGPESAAIRQIAHEVLKTVIPGYRKNSTSKGFIFGQPTLSREPITTAPVAAPVPKVGRNEKCPCGSGKKFKKCHGFRR
jgi:hypothetical protein